MSDKKISELTELTAPDGTEELVVNDSGTSKKITQANLFKLGDNVKAKFGAGDDLQIYHDGSHSYIEDSGTGNLRIDAQSFQIRKQGTAENIAGFAADGAVSLFYDGAQKLATTATGVDVTGSVTCDGFTSTGIDDNATSTAITIDASENVGIGTASPSAKLNTVADDIWFQNAAQSYGLSIKADDAGAATKIRQLNSGGDIRLSSGTASGELLFDTASTERMRINSSGQVLINTNALPNGTSVYGSGFTPNSNDRANLYMASSVTTTSSLILFYNPNGGVGTITTNGSATSYNTSSDYRLKENVVPMTGSIDRLKDLKPSRFNFKADTDKTVDGFLAHEAQAIVPEAVTGTKDAMMDEEYEVTPAVMDGDTVVTEAVMGTRSVPDYQGIDQSKLVPLLVASLQEAIARIEVLENA